jgi:hypothetical protein
MIVMRFYIGFYTYLEVLDFLMGCDLENIYAKAERYTSEKPVNEN